MQEIIEYHRRSQAKEIPKQMLYRVPLVFAPQPEGGFTVTSPVLPELVTEGATIQEGLANAQDALSAVLEIYAEQGRPLPAGI